MRILLVGLPRSGTTWIASALAHAPGVQYVHEPENRGSSPYAELGMRGLSNAPALVPGRRVRAFERLWDVAFARGWPSGRRGEFVTSLARGSRLPKPLGNALLTATAEASRRRHPASTHQLVKTVNAYLSVEWLADRYRPTVVVAWRNPLNGLPGLLSRDARMGMIGPAIERRLTGTAAWPPPPLETIERATWNTCARMTMLFDQADRHPDWIVVQHEELCLDPLYAFRYLFARIGLDWSDDVAAFLEESNQPGETFDTHRVTRDQVDAWMRLTPEQLEGAVIQMRRFLEIVSIGPRIESSLAVLAPLPTIIDLRDPSKPRAKKRRTGATRTRSSRRTINSVSSPE